MRLREGEKVKLGGRKSETEGKRDFIQRIG
jgi:hypothetical protein